MHWRGDRSGGFLPGGDPLDETAAFEAFNGAFEGLLGRTGPLTDEEMHSFADFALQLTYPPNPIRALDNSLTPAQQRGRAYFFNFADGGTQRPCEGCHTLAPGLGFFGTEGLSAKLEIPLKIPHLRNLYTKEGITSQRDPPEGPQIRGFAFLHDGTKDSLFAFLQRAAFGFPGGDAQRKDVVAFLLAFDSNMAPIVGHQVTVTPMNVTTARQTVDLMISRADVTPEPECQVIAKGARRGEARSWLRTSQRVFRSDRLSEPAIGLNALMRIVTVAGHELTFTCVPPGSGKRMGLDRDEDGYYDRDELDAGSDPADPGSTPPGVR